MGISLPIGSHLDDGQARRTARQAEDYFSTAGRRAGDEFSNNLNQGLNRVDTGRARQQADQLQRAYDRAADAAGKLRAEEAKLEEVNSRSTSTNAQKIVASERVERARRNEARATRDAVNALRDMENESRTASAAADSLTISSSTLVSSLGTSLTSAAEAAKGGLSSMVPDELASSLSQLAIDVGIFAAKATGLVGAVGMAGGAAAELSGIIGTLPGVISGSVAAFGSLKLATVGFSDAIGDIKDPEKFAKDLADLSPNAQQAALAIQAMMPAFDGLKNATQDALFVGMGQEFNRLADSYLPALQQMTTTIAGSFGQMFKGVTDQLMTPETQAAIRSAMANIGQAFQNLVPAIGPVTKAIADLANVSSSFLPGFASGIAGVATQFSTFLSNAARTGELRQWISEGVDAFKSFGDILPAVRDLFMDFKSNGKTAMDDIVWLTKKAIEVTGWLGDKYDNISGFVKMYANTAVTAFNAVGSAISNSLQPLRELIELNNKYNPLSRISGRTIDQIPTFKPLEMPSPGYGNLYSSMFGADAGGGRTPGHAMAPPGLHPGTASPGLGGVAGLSLSPSGVPAYPDSPYAVPVVPDKDGKAKKLPTVPMSNTDPMSLLQGFPATASLYGAAGSVLDNQQKVAQAKSDLNTLEKANVRDEDAITAKRNELARAQREEHESELRLTEAKQQAVQKSLKGMQTASGELQQLGVQLDKDFGISKGLGGIVENAVKALGNILAAPFLRALGFVAKANPNEGSGLVGIMAANGAFGSQYTPGAIAMMQASQRGGGGYSGGYAPVAAAVGGGQPYGLPNGTDIRQGAPGFPSWVYQVASAFGLQASTYAGHQEDKGQGNQGIDWWGPVENRQRFAEWLAQNRGMPGLEDVIFENPNTGQDIGVNNGRLVGTPGSADPGYFRRGKNDFADHRDHVHTTQSESLGLPGAPQATDSLNGLASAANSAANALGGPGGGWNADWNTMAQKEASGNWSANTGNGFYGGLQFTQPSWDAAGGTQYAPRADLASPYQQALTAEQLLQMQGPGAWPNTFTPGLAGPAAPGGGPMYPGIGPSQALPGMSPLGQVTPAVGGGTAYPSQGGNSGNIVGGLAMDGIMAATSGLDMMMPGAGAAAKIGIQVANRTIGYATQNAGIAANAIGEFFSVGDNPKGSIGAGWFGKIAGGLAGAGAALPNIAGQKAPQQQGNGQQQGGNTNNVNNTINVQAREGASGQEHGEQVAAETSRMYAPAGRQ